MAQVTVDFSQKALMEGFLGFLQRRSSDRVYARHGTILSEFIDKFMVAEMQRLERHDEMIPGTIDIPDGLLAPHARRTTATTVPAPAATVKARPASRVAAPAVIDAAPSERRRTAPTPATTLVPRSPATRALVEAAAQADPVLTPTPARNGNGHMSEKKRPLSSDEKNRLRRRFRDANGQIPEDRTVTWTAEFNEGLAADQRLSAFQVPGFIAFLHGQVTAGTLEVRDLDAYKLFLEAHHARYPKRYPQVARRARRAAPEATTQDAAARALWTKSGVNPSDILGLPVPPSNDQGL